MNIKNRLKKLEEMALTVNQEDKIVSFLEAVEAYLFEESSGVVSAETAQRLEDSASEFNFGKNLIKGEKQMTENYQKLLDERNDLLKEVERLENYIQTNNITERPLTVKEILSEPDINKRQQLIIKNLHLFKQ